MRCQFSSPWSHRDCPISASMCRWTANLRSHRKEQSAYHHDPDRTEHNLSRQDSWSRPAADYRHAISHIVDDSDRSSSVHSRRKRRPGRPCQVWTRFCTCRPSWDRESIGEDPRRRWCRAHGCSRTFCIVCSRWYARKSKNNTNQLSSTVTLFVDLSNFVRRRWLTWLEKWSSRTPIGMKAMERMKNVGRTVPAVSTGCQLGSLKWRRRNDENQYLWNFHTIATFSPLLFEVWVWKWHCC